jgi:glycerophosphoryl diester phosphodiesterase
MAPHAPLEFSISGRHRVICCHRATLSGQLPPNSLAAIEECVAARVPRLEIDVRFLSDDGMLIFHDSDLADETNATGRVDALDTSAARKLRYRAHGDHPVAFLADVVDAMRGRDTLLQVDLKLMRPMSAARELLLARALEPVRDTVLIGTQAHWNLRGLASRGFRVAFDPYLHWYYATERDVDSAPTRLGVHGFWDDAPLAHIPHATAADYFEQRVRDLIGLLPAAAEWMVGIPTLRRMAEMGFALGHRLEQDGIELAAWTLRDRGAETAGIFADLFALGATTVIADDAPAVAAYAATLAPVSS